MLSSRQKLSETRGTEEPRQVTEDGRKQVKEEQVRQQVCKWNRGGVEDIWWWDEELTNLTMK